MATAKKPASTKKPSAAKKAAAASKKHGAPAVTGPYLYSLGRRKSATAMVRLYMTGTGNITINGKPAGVYLGVEELRESVNLPLKALGLEKTSDIVAVAHGGGLRGQADAVKLGVARALLKLDANFRTTLKPKGYLMRDPREKERKKYGLKKARKSPQWAKR